MMMTNFKGKLRPQDIKIGPSHFMGSLWVEIRVTFEIGSATGDIVTFSMSGYGRPAWALVRAASRYATGMGFGYRLSLSDASLVYMTLFHSISFGSLQATVSLPMIITALIASR